MINLNSIFFILLVSSIVLVISIIAITLLEKKYKQGINESSSVNDSIILRKRLRTLRNISIFLLIFFNIGFLVLFLFQELPKGFLFPISTIIGPGAFAIAWNWKTFRWDKTIKGNISVLGRDSVISSHRPFALYLRGFKEDNYASEVELANSNPSNYFSEYHFTSFLKTKIPVYAVGMTKESDSPYGAKRIYLEDETWQEDVINLMEKAKVIYILVNDRDSCIWEIEQSISFKEKTFYLVDNIEKYEHVRERLNDIILLPEISNELAKDHICCINYKEGTPDISYFNNTKEGYQKFLEIDVPKETQNKGKRKKGCSYIYWICLSVFLGFILIMGIIQNIKETNNKNKETTIVNVEPSIANEYKSEENIFVENGCVDSLDFVFTCFSENNIITYVSKHLKPSEQTDFCSFLLNEKDKINRYKYVQLLYDGTPRSYTMLRKVVCNSVKIKVKCTTFLHIISYLKYKDFEDKICKLAYQGHSCISESGQGVIEIIKEEGINYDNIDSIKTRKELYTLGLEACKQYNRVINGTEKNYFFIDALPFDISIASGNKDDDHKIYEAYSSIPYLKKMDKEVLTPFIINNLIIKLESKNTTDEIELIKIPLPNIKNGIYIFQLDVDANETITLNIIEKNTSNVVFSNSLDNFL